MQRTETFETVYQTLVDSINFGSGTKVGTNVLFCVGYYDKSNISIMEHQVKRVSDAVWTNHRFADSTVLISMLAPYMTSDKLETPTTSLLDHPNIIRSCLYLAKFVDDEGITMDGVKRANVTSFLNKLPGFTKSHDLDAPLLPRVANALLGGQWTSICTLYNVAEEGVLNFRASILDLPSSILHASKTLGTTLVSIPDTLST